MIILGVDPGSRSTGYGVVSVEGNRIRCVDYGAIRPKGRPQELPMQERLKTIFDGLEAVILQHRPEVAAVESVFHAANVKSALTLGHVRGVVLLALANSGVALREYSPLEVKRAVAGYGRADKQQVQTMVRMLLKLAELPQPHDASDALAIALCQAFSGGRTTRRHRRWRSAEVSSSG
jgi:crossover junction endodeoxyribonuclease RuvC